MGILHRKKSVTVNIKSLCTSVTALFLPSEVSPLLGSGVCHFHTFLHYVNSSKGGMHCFAGLQCRVSSPACCFPAHRCAAEAPHVA